MTCTPELSRAPITAVEGGGGMCVCVRSEYVNLLLSFSPSLPPFSPSLSLSLYLPPSLHPSLPPSLMTGLTQSPCGPLDSNPPQEEHTGVMIDMQEGHLVVFLAQNEEELMEREIVNTSC